MAAITRVRVPYKEDLTQSSLANTSPDYLLCQGRCQLVCGKTCLHTSLLGGGPEPAGIVIRIYSAYNIV